MAQRDSKSGDLRPGTKTRWEVVFDEEFLKEFQAWSDGVQDAILGLIIKLRVFGPSLGRPNVDTLKGSECDMKELRVDAEGGVWRIAFAFEPSAKPFC